MSATMKNVARDKVREMEDRLLTLTRLWGELGRPEGHPHIVEYRRLHPKWMQAKQQLQMDL